MLACLRKVDAYHLLTYSYDTKGMSSIFNFHPTMDGKFLANDVTLDVRKNAENFMPVKMLIGYSKDEGSLFAVHAMYHTNYSLYQTTSKEDFNELSSQLSSFYRLPVDLKNSEVKSKIHELYDGKTQSRFFDIAAFIGDGLIKCPVNTFVKAYAAAHPNVYVYRYDRKLAKPNPKLDSESLGVFHTLPFVHMSGLMVTDEEIDAADKAYALDSIKMVADFVRSDDAPKFQNVQWPNFSKNEGVFVFDQKSYAVPDLPSESRCHKVFPAIA